MGKIVERITLTSFLDPTKSEEVGAVVDTGATMLVLPMDLVERLGLRKIRDARVRYANEQVKLKSIYAVVALVIQGDELVISTPLWRLPVPNHSSAKSSWRSSSW